MPGDLLLHCGAREVSRDELNSIEAPPATRSWFPLKHGLVLDTVQNTLEGAGFQVTKCRMGLSRGNARFFGTLDLDAAIGTGIHLAVGIRNSMDKSFPLSFCAGHRTFVCDNLAFASELMVTRKHSKFGGQRFEEGIAGAVQSLGQFREAEARRITYMQGAGLSEDAANSYLLRAYEENLVTSRLLSAVIREWREPRFEEFRPRTMFSLLNAFTTVLGQDRKVPQAQHAAHTMRLQRFLLPHTTTE
jgi:hypothetical protein